MKKFMSIMLTMGLMASSMSLGFAATDVAKEIEDKDVKEAVERLAAFGIVNGMEDGKYHEELKVTREQFAKILVTALGLESAAIQGPTQFADVEAGRWSSGYVNVAVGQGILKGYPDGTFQPTKEVSYGEAVTMLVRALGYKDEFLPGQWPSNYIAKAADEDITDGVKFASVGTANRGDVAVMVNNTLDAVIIEVQEYGGSATSFATYKKNEDDKTLLQDKLDIDTYKEVRLVENQRVNDSLDKDEVVFEATSDNITFLGTKKDEGDDFSKTELKDVMPTDEFLGLQVKVYVNDDDEIVYIERDGNEKVVTDAITKVTTSEKEVKLYTEDDEFEFVSAPTVYITGEDSNNKVDKYTTEATALAAVDAGMFGRIVFDGDEIVFADVIKADATAETAMVVTKVDSKTKEITGLLDTDDDFTLDLEDDYDNYMIMDAVTREALSFDDIKENQAIYAVKQEIDGDDYAMVYVVRDNTVEGKLNKTKNASIEIDGKSIDIVENNTNLNKDGETFAYKTTYSANKNDDIYDYNSDFNADDKDIEDLNGEEVTVIKDVVGRALHILGDASETSSTMYGVVTRDYADKDKIKIFVASKNDEVTYNFEDEDNAANLVKGDFVKFKLNKAGEIAEDEIFEAEMTSGDYVQYQVKTEFGKSTIETVGGKTFSVGDDTMFIDAPNLDETANGHYAELVANATTPTNTMFDTDDLDKINWADIKEDSVAAAEGQFVAFVDDKNELEAVLFIGAGIGSATDDEEAAYVIDTWKEGGDEKAKVEFFDGEIKEMTVDSGSESAIKDEMGAVVKVQSDGELEFVDTTSSYTGDFSIVAGTVYDKDGDFIKLFTDTNADGDWDAGETVGTVFYKMSSDTVVYDEDNKKSKSNVSEGKKVEIVVENGIEVRVLELQ